MAAAASTALTAVSEQAAPVQVTTEFVLLTCAGAWAVATAADGLAFRARQPLLALVPALGLFVFPAVIRPSSPAWYTTWFMLGAAGMLLFEGRARLATWGRWVSSARSRPGAGWRLPLTPAAQTGRWLALAAGLCALTVPWLLPGYGQQPVLDLKESTGTDAGVALNPFISLRTRLTAQEDVPMFRARSTQRERWRLMVYDRFDGTDFATSSNPNLRPYLETGSLDREVRERADRLVEANDADTPFGKALAIQDYLRDPKVFRYNLNVPALSAGGNQLRRFLTEVREGYCEQFAIAMAMMARQVGVPSRVAVGFTSGEVVDNNFLQVTTHDAHAWPELWFPETGWVPFEPTPRADGTVAVPSYTTPAGRVPSDDTGTTPAPDATGPDTPANPSV